MLNDGSSHNQYHSFAVDSQRLAAERHSVGSSFAKVPSNHERHKPAERTVAFGAYEDQAVLELLPHVPSQQTLIEECQATIEDAKSPISESINFEAL